MNVWQLEVGDSLPNSFSLGPISRSDIVRYQGASGDFQPVHHDEEFARKAGYDAPLVVGMYPAGAISLWAAELFGPESVRQTAFRFSAMVWPGDTLRGEGQVTSRDGTKREIGLRLTNQQDECVLTCRMTFESEV
jgi:acyl dehydratase